MDVSRRAVYASGAVIVAVTLVSGPLVGAVDLTSEPGPAITDQFGNGSADVTVESLPDSLRISEGRYGSEQYYLRVPDLVVDVSNVVGQPFVRYDVDIDGLGFSTSTNAFLSPDSAGRLRLTMDDVPLKAGEVTRSRYNATLVVVVHANGSDRVIERKTVVVEVGP